jgi:hypothetical protein
MPIITILFLEIVCLVIDLLFFHAAIFHILLICVLITASIFNLFKNKKKALYAFVAIPIVGALSTAGYLIEWHLKDLVGEPDSTCFVFGNCDFQKGYLGYRIKPVYKAQGRAKDMIVIDGYNHSFLIYDPTTRKFERSEM